VLSESGVLGTQKVLFFLFFFQWISGWHQGCCQGSHKSEQLSAARDQDDDSDVLIECRDVYKSFGEKKILNGVSFKVRGFVLDNGFGYVTLLCTCRKGKWMEFFPWLQINLNTELSLNLSIITSVKGKVDKLIITMRETKFLLSFHWFLL